MKSSDTVLSVGSRRARALSASIRLAGSWRGFPGLAAAGRQPWGGSPGSPCPGWAEGEWNPCSRRLDRLGLAPYCVVSGRRSEAVSGQDPCRPHSLWPPSLQIRTDTAHPLSIIASCRETLEPVRQTQTLHRHPDDSRPTTAAATCLWPPRTWTGHCTTSHSLPRSSSSIASKQHHCRAQARLWPCLLPCPRTPCPRHGLRWALRRDSPTPRSPTPCLARRFLCPGPGRQADRPTHARPVHTTRPTRADTRHPELYPPAHCTPGTGRALDQGQR